MEAACRHCRQLILFVPRIGEEELDLLRAHLRHFHPGEPTSSDRTEGLKELLPYFDSDPIDKSHPVPRTARKLLAESHDSVYERTVLTLFARWVSACVIVSIFAGALIGGRGACVGLPIVWSLGGVGFIAHALSARRETLSPGHLTTWAGIAALAGPASGYIVRFQPSLILHLPIDVVSTPALFHGNLDQSMRRRKRGLLHGARRQGHRLNLRPH